MATYEVKGIFSICLILCVLEGSYFLLFWHNKQIIFTWIIYRSIFGIEKKYSWEDVKTVCYKSIGRGANRILIQTDKKIYIETGMMKKCEDVERVIKEKGYYYYGINSLNVKYDQDNIYELSYVLQDEKLTFDDLVDDMDFKIISNKDEEEVAKVYNLEKFNVIECSNNKKIVANKNNKVNSDICELVIE